MARPRIHQHVNPLARYFRELPVEPLDLAGAFENPDLPLHIDIGCARGRFILQMAQEDGEFNYLGLEIREPLVVDANKTRDEEGLGNLHYEFCNATLDLGTLLEGLPAGVLKRVTIQFPDPWFKKKHAKRRMVKDEMVGVIAKHLAPDGTVLLQTDVEFVSEEMVEVFESTGLFDVQEIDSNPLPLKTEREIAVENKGDRVFRYIARLKE